MKSRRSIKAKVASLKNSNKMHKSLRTHLYSFPFMEWNDYANLEVCWGWWSGLRANPPLPSNDILYGCRFVSWLQPSQSGTQFMAWGSKCNTVQSLGIVHLYRESGKKSCFLFLDQFSSCHRAGLRLEPRDGRSFSLTRKILSVKQVILYIKSVVVFYSSLVITYPIWRHPNRHLMFSWWKT